MGLGVGAMVSAVRVVGGRSGTSPILTTKMQESTDGSNNWTDCTGGNFGAQTNANAIDGVSYFATKQFQRATHTLAGTTPVFPVHVVVIAARKIAPLGDGGWNNNAAGG